MVQGTRAVSGISFDISGMDEVSISKRTFKRMPNLRFLSVYKSKEDENDVLHIPEELEFPRRLRLLQFSAYPSKCLPPKLYPEHLIKLCMRDSKLEYLWQGSQLLANLKHMDLSKSFHLKKLPDLSNATNLEKLDLASCSSLVEIPSSCSHLQKLKRLWIRNCINLEFIPPQLNLPSLELVNMAGCSRLRNFSVISTKFRTVDISETVFEEVPPSVSLCSGLERLVIKKSGNLKELTHLPTSLWWLELSYCDIERIPDCIKDLHGLERPYVTGCKRLTSLLELPHFLKCLHADDCESLETLFSPLNISNAELKFTNCFKLDQQARQEIIQQSFIFGLALLPGRQMPAEFVHRARGNVLIISPDDENPCTVLFTLKLCVVLSPISEYRGEEQHLTCNRIGDGNLGPVEEVFHLAIVSNYRAEHLVIFEYDDPYIDPSEGISEMVLEFTSKSQEFEIIECGAYLCTDKKLKGSYPHEFGKTVEVEESYMPKLDQILKDILATFSYENELGEAVDEEYGDSTNEVISEEILNC